MNRRELLEGGAVAGAMLGLPVVSKARPSVANESRLKGLLNDSMIWSAEALPVPLLKKSAVGGIADTASQGKDAPPDFFSDFHGAFRKPFDLGQPVRAAQFHIFAYSRYRLYINGRYVGRGPSRYDNHRPEYDTWDVAPFLVKGRNVIAVLAHRDSPTGRIMYHAPGMSAVLALSNGGNSPQFVASDETWQAQPERSFLSREVAWASIHEAIDARETANWISPDYDSSHWPPALKVGGSDFPPLYPRTIALLRETTIPWREAVFPHDLSAGQQVELRLDKLILGYHRLTFAAESGSEIEVRYGLPEHQSSGKGSYIARSGTQVWEGGDSFAFSTLTVSVISGHITLTSASAVEVRYPFDRLGRFESSDTMLNDLWSLCARSLEVLSEDAYIDCADRERVEWTDETPPAFECTRVMMATPKADGGHIYGDSRLLKALLQRIAFTQKPDGQIKAHSCSERWDIHAIMEDRSCDWVIALRQYFESSGDADFVRAMWPTVTRLLDWFLRQRTPRGLVLAREWEVWDNPLRYQVCEGAGLNAFVYHALIDAAWLGMRIGATSQAAEFTVAAHDLSNAFNTLLWDEAEGAYYGGLFGEGSKLSSRLDGKMFAGPFENGRYQPTLQAALFALDAGIVPAARLARLQRWVLAHQDEARLCMSHHFLFKALYGLDQTDADCRVLDLMRAKWKGMVESPWGTSWEGLQDWGGSKVHIYGIVPGYFLSAYVLGVRLEGPASDRVIRIEPRPGDLTHAAGVVVTEFGPVPVAWTRSGSGAIKLSVTVPQDCRARLRLQRGASDRIVVNGDSRAAKSEGAFSCLTLRSGRYEILSMP